MISMSRAAKIGIVLGGYLGSLLLATAAMYLRMLATEYDPAAQAASGMYAFGDSIVFVFVFGFGGLVPTGFAFYFLRPVKRFWTLLSILGVAVASTALIGVTAMFAERLAPQPGFLELAAMFGVERMLLTPPLAALFLLAALFAPSRRPRWILALAACAECLAALSWLGWLFSRR